MLISPHKTRSDNCENVQSVINYPLLSFFTGAGFLDIGFIMAGFKTIWVNEHDQCFITGYEYGMKNLGGDIVKPYINNSSVVDVGPNQIIKEAFGGSFLPSTYGIIGGPPCPDFSTAGKNKGIEGHNGKITWVFTKRIIELQPSFFIFENVPGLIKTTKHLTFFNTMLLKLQDDYVLDYKIFNALEYGVPQDRQRLFLVGFLKKWLKKNLNIKPELLSSDWFPWPEPVYPGAKYSYCWPSIVPFGSNPRRPKNIPKELMVGTYICNTSELEKLPNGLDVFNPKSEKFNTIAEGDVARKSFKRLHRWRFSPTAAYGNNEVHLHPFLPRRLSVREALRIQTVPDSFVLPPEMSLTGKFKTIGNGVPVKLSRAVAESILKVIRGCINERS